MRRRSEICHAACPRRSAAGGSVLSIEDQPSLLPHCVRALPSGVKILAKLDADSRTEAVARAAHLEKSKDRLRQISQGTYALSNKERQALGAKLAQAS